MVQGSEPSQQTKQGSHGHENIWNFEYLVFLAFWVIFSAVGKGIWAYYLRYQISPKMPNGHENAWFLAKMLTQCPFKCLNQLAWRSQNILFLLFLTLSVSICKKFALQHLENSRSHLNIEHVGAYFILNLGCFSEPRFSPL